MIRIIKQEYRTRLQIGVFKVSDICSTSDASAASSEIHRYTNLTDSGMSPLNRLNVKHKG